MRVDFSKFGFSKRAAAALLALLALLILLSGMTAFAAEPPPGTHDLPEKTFPLYQEGGYAPAATARRSREFLVPFPTEEVERLVAGAIESYQTSVNITSLRIPCNDPTDPNDPNWVMLSEAFFAFINRRPDYFYVRGRLGAKVADSPSGMFFATLEMEFIDTPERCRAMQAEFDAGVSRALASVPAGVSDAEKALAINDYLAYQTEYDALRLSNDTLPPESYSAYGTLVKRISVCHGYALAFELLMQMMGVEAEFVGSVPMNHAWNMVKIDGFWYHVDVTWNDQPPEIWGYAGHKNFLLSDAAVRLTGHTYWPPTLPPAVSTKYDNFFWSDVTSAFVYNGGEWLYADHIEKNLKSYSFGTNARTVRMPFSHSNQTLPRIYRCGGWIYYNADNGIRRVDPNSFSDNLFYSSAPVAQMRIDGYTALVRLGGGGESSVLLCDRLAGDDRILTAIEASKAGWTTADNVLLADGRNFPDALTGGPLAHMLNAPILLTRGGSSAETAVLARISGLSAKNIYILGGEMSVSAGIENQLRGLGYNVTRLAGQDRYETSVAIAKKMDELRGSPPSMIFVADSVGFADALSVTPVAALLNAPIILTPNNRVGFTAASSDYAGACGAKMAVIVGGISAVKPDVETRLGWLGFSFQRVWGENRYETSAKIYQTYKSVLTEKTAVIATGVDFPDALGGGVLCAKLKAPLLLVNGSGSSVSAPIRSAIAAIAPRTVYVLGGQNAVSDAAAARHLAA